MVGGCARNECSWPWCMKGAGKKSISSLTGGASNGDVWRGNGRVTLWMRLRAPRTRASGAPRLAGAPRAALVDGLGLSRHVIHQQILAERVWGREVGLAAAHFGDFLHELY